MRKKFLLFSMNAIKKKFPEYSEEKLEEIEYGIEALYITLTKTFVIALISLLLGVIKEVFLIVVFYNILRTTAFGMHAKTSLQCYIISIVLFIGLGLVCKYVEISPLTKVIISIICLIHIIIFAPADTYKRPLINKKRRYVYKYVSISIGIIYSILIYLMAYKKITSYILFGMVDATIMIHPLVYWLFKLPYNNYKTYKE